MIINYSVETLFELEEELLEGPIFDNYNNVLYFVSILGFKVYRYNPLNKELIFIKLDSPTSCVYITKKHEIVAASLNGFFQLDFNKLNSNLLFDIDLENNLRFNDGILDYEGRFLIGTMGYPEIIENKGSLLSYNVDTGLKTLITGTTISNGLAFTKDSKKMYFIDTPTRVVKEYSYNLHSGNCKFLREVIKFKNEGVPDGMDIDNNGNLWIAEWGGSCISVWNPDTGKQLASIDLPAKNITSLTFDNKENVYITSANSNNKNFKKSSKLFFLRINYE